MPAKPALVALALSALLHAGGLWGWRASSPQTGPAAATPPTQPLLGRFVATTPPPSTAPAAQPAGASSTSSTSADPAYWPAEALQQLPLPVSAPDVALLEGSELSAERLRLRLYISATGAVDEVEVLGAEAGDVQPLRRMFQHTRFLPARRAGREVASQMDIEIELSELLRVI
ncbi:hypothetical protein [Uliginosibacterium aquaticum]|uniref:TonB C-terminal domain-containing protein n=1 Tax=Uliginosibacterium aquaticum TaxID=2731212 RepID=A0ABX2IFV3_9RHOO|nr:hypothetical protein [Uliginosibacterium aquaticum]NSL55639.1 hypothetical protein [Uliginosibacterium aquaticum]